MAVTERRSLPFGLSARNVLVLMVFGCRVVQTAMRMAMGTLVIYICEEFECGEGSKGWLLSAHAIGYTTTQILGGHIADQIGGKAIITWAMALSGIALAATPAVAPFGLSGVAAAQVVMGVAMGPLFPASMRLLAKWLPSTERAFASTALDTGITLGSLVTVPLSGALAVVLGWRATIALVGASGIVFAVSWALVAAEDPETCGYCGEDERALLASQYQPAKKVAAQVPEGEARRGMLECIGHACLWAIYVAHFSFNFAMYFVNSWSAIYYLEVFGLRPQQAGLLLSLPLAVNLLVNVLVCPALQRALKKFGFSDLACRRTFTGAGFLVPAGCFWLLPQLTDAYATAACFSTAFGFLALHPSGFKANYMDVTRDRGGLVSGIGNTIASVASSIGPIVVAQLRAATGSWGPPCFTVSVLCLLAAGVFCTLSSTTPIEAKEAEVAASQAKKES